jgi:hypothetical protein
MEDPIETALLHRGSPRRDDDVAGVERRRRLALDLAGSAADGRVKAGR